MGSTGMTDDHLIQTALRTAMRVELREARSSYSFSRADMLNAYRAARDLAKDYARLMPYVEARCIAKRHVRLMVSQRARRAAKEA